ncbi:MAG: TlpA family protein disulfide reductase [Paludibacterium sp.]|uniref:TlpA disulfide reductase family protein n=1 Tax=Paludibacterium sp. TaxID=1917523 RepID=UPI0025D355A4|nr:TlpA disulfide reductase family protein [Paludibacterium sp.]MBV8047284.1 TlpA family protein disulfide reductase [Paludibacterium sp.]MBV8648319.1 TlpA family protein disulfide reductase [Paludibacterium sp.]
MPQTLHSLRLTASALLFVSCMTQAGPLDNTAFTDLNGHAVKLADLRGKTVLVNFWGTWCGPCRKEMPMLDALRQKWKNRGVEVIGIALDDKKAVIPFIQQQKIHYPIWLGDENTTDLLPTLGDPGINVPFTLLIDKNGAISQHWIGAVEQKPLEKAIFSLPR